VASMDRSPLLPGLPAAAAAMTRGLPLFLRDSVRLMRLDRVACRAPHHTTPHHSTHHL
jgi:hypothetical protein